MFKAGDKVQFSKFGARGLTGFVRGIKFGYVQVQWRPGDLQWVKSEDLVKLPESRYDRIAEKVAGEVDLSLAKKAILFERWLTQAGIPFEKTVKQEEWLLGTDVSIEYFIKSVDFELADDTQVFFSLRVPNREVARVRRNTSESVYARHGKEKSSDIRQAFAFAKWSRRMSHNQL